MDKLTRRYEEALKIIRNMGGYGSAVGTCRQVACYVLGEGYYKIDDEYKILIDNSDKIPVIWGRKNK